MLVGPFGGVSAPWDWFCMVMVYFFLIFCDSSLWDWLLDIFSLIVPWPFPEVFGFGFFSGDWCQQLVSILIGFAAWHWSVSITFCSIFGRPFSEFWIFNVVLAGSGQLVGAHGESMCPKFPEMNLSAANWSSASNSTSIFCASVCDGKVYLWMDYFWHLIFNKAGTPLLFSVVRDSCGIMIWWTF